MTVAALSLRERVPRPFLSGPYGGRFTVAYAALALAALTSGVMAYTFGGAPPPRATTHTHAARAVDPSVATALAGEVTLHYPQLAGRPAFTIAARKPSLGPYELRNVVLPGTGRQSTQGMVEYTFCGQGLFCSLAPDAPVTLQQADADAEAVQLALDTFATMPSVGGVLEFLPGLGMAVPPAALYFRRSDLQPLAEGELDASLAAALLEQGTHLKTLPAPLREVIAAADAHAYLFHATVGPHDTTWLKLRSLPPTTTSPHPLP